MTLERFQAIYNLYFLISDGKPLENETDAPPVTTDVGGDAVSLLTDDWVIYQLDAGA